jgi:CRISPR-associated protein (TIGR03984 family)
MNDEWYDDPATLMLEAIAAPCDGTRAGVEAAWGSEPGIALGHADDGVIWGRLQDARFVLASDSGLHGARLRPETLRDLRVFNMGRELRVWWARGKLQANIVRQLQTGASCKGAPQHQSYACAVDRTYPLLGPTNRTPATLTRKDGFYLLRGPAGQEQAAPGLSLRVRTYFHCNLETGLLREAAHRYLGMEDQ